jgi:hypothetical protein
MNSSRSSNPAIMPAPPRVGCDPLVAHERGVLALMSRVCSKAMSSVVEGDHVAIHTSAMAEALRPAIG